MSERSFSEVVKNCISKFKENATPYIYNHVTGDQTDICKIVSEQNFLPIFYEWTTFCSVRPNGEMVWCDYDNPQKMEVEHNERLRNIAMVKGIKRFPELQPFLPQRKSDDIDCPYCESTENTRQAMPEHLQNVLNCYCGRLGWIPKNCL